MDEIRRRAISMADHTRFAGIGLLNSDSSGCATTWT